LAASLLAATFVGLLVVEVTFVFWLQLQVSRERGLALRMAALSVQSLPDEPDSAYFVSAVGQLAAEQGVVVTWWDRASKMHQTSVLSLPLDRLGKQSSAVVAGYEHLSVPVADDARLALLIVSAKVETSVREVMARQPRVLAFLSGVGLLIVLLGLALLRRAVARPVQRMTELVRQRDRDALSRFESDTPDELAQLSRAVLHMTQQSEDDGVRIAAQLAELKTAHDHLTSTQHQLVRSERLAVVGQLAAGLAHEIGNPLAILDGYIDVLRRGDISAADSSLALEHMAKELQRLQATIRALLDFSRASAGSADQPGDVGQAIAHVRSLAKPQKKLAAIDLQLPELAPGLLVAVDANALTQVLVNLILNAADAIHGKGTILVSVVKGPVDVTVCVDDTGPGIAAELRQRVFDPFFTTKPAGAGTGLGLSVCERIVTSAGGEIVAEQGELGGARLRFSVPLAAGR